MTRIHCLKCGCAITVDESERRIPNTIYCGECLNKGIKIVAKQDRLHD